MTSHPYPYPCAGACFLAALLLWVLDWCCERRNRRMQQTARFNVATPQAETYRSADWDQE